MALWVTPRRWFSGIFWNGRKCTHAPPAGRENLRNGARPARLGQQDPRRATAHTCHPRHSMPRRECAGRAVASAGASHRPHAASVGRNGATPGGLLLDPTPFRLRGGPEGVRRRERSSPGKGRTAHPEAPAPTPHNAATPPPTQRTGGGADAGCGRPRPGYARPDDEHHPPRPQAHTALHLQTAQTPTHPHPRTPEARPGELAEPQFRAPPRQTSGGTTQPPDNTATQPNPAPPDGGTLVHDVPRDTS